MDAFFHLVFLLLWLGSIWWIYHEEEDGDPILWTLLTAAFSFIPLAVYAYLAKSRTATLLSGAFVALGILQALALVVSAHH
jgi:FtsH-binding integral membrane protein